MGVEPMNNGFAGRRVSHFATRADVDLNPLSKAKPTAFWQWVRQNSDKTCRLTPHARVGAHATHVRLTGRHGHQEVHKFTLPDSIWMRKPKFRKNSSNS